VWWMIGASVASCFVVLFLFGRRNRIGRFARYVAKRTPPAKSLDVAIGHSLCPDDAVELERQLHRLFDNIHRTTVTDVGAALGVHCGPGSLVVATQPYTRPEIKGQSP